MNRFFLAAMLFFSGVLACNASDSTFYAVVTDSQTDKSGKTSMPSSIKKIYLYFTSSGTEKDDVLKGAWIADDIGSAAVRHTQIAEMKVTCPADNCQGDFVLNSDNGFPIGTYHVDIWEEDEPKPSATVNFNIRE